MKICTIAISSVTHAIRGEKALSANNIKCRIAKLQPNKTKKGCAYGLEINCKQLSDALHALEKYSIPYSEIVR